MVEWQFIAGEPPMMSDEQITYELEYWQTHNDDLNAIYRGLVAMWDVRPARRLLEIGAGPLNGCLPLMPAESKTSIDPLNSTYSATGLIVEDANIRYVNEYVENWDAGEAWDAIICANAIDHGAPDWPLLFRKIAKLLEPDGRLYFHQNLRTETQCNLGHPVPLSWAELRNLLKHNGLVQLKAELFQRCPFWHSHYLTVVGTWQKEAS
jgi:cyclopropane fatty-acyl-phospholipid synthase-like methyltransferase